MRKLIFFCLMMIFPVALIIMTGCGKNTAITDEEVTARISLAAQMMDKGLYDEASVEYRAAFDTPGVSNKKRANISYLLGNLYFEKMKNYEKALGWYIRAKHYDPQSPVMQQLTERTVSCLERIGRSLDAQNVLSGATYLAGEETRREPGKIVAQIEGRSITMGELDNEIQKLPTEEQKKYRDNPEAKLEFLRQYVNNELLFNMAKRADYQKDPRLREQVENFEKMLMVSRIYKERVADAVNITPEEVRQYFEAHKADLAKALARDGGTSDTKTSALPDTGLFEKTAPRIATLLKTQKAQEKESRLIEELMRTQKVVIYDGEFGK
jgi:tetratricopeptide (TPR) repeat protein